MPENPYISAERLSASISNSASPVLAIDLTENTSKMYYKIGLDQNVVFFRSGSEIAQILQVDGGHDVVSLGGTYRPTNTSSSATLFFMNATGTVTVKGASIDNSAGGERDGIVIQGAAGVHPNLVIADSVITGIQGSYAGFHGDMVQSYGSLGDVTISNFYGSTNYQGLFFGSIASMAPSSLTLDKVTLDFADGKNAYPVLLWIGGGAGNPVIPVTMTDLVLDAKAATRGTDFATVIYDGTQLIKGQLSGSTVTWASEDISGSASLGVAGSASANSAKQVAGGAFDTTGELARSLGVEKVVYGTAAAETLKAVNGSAALFGGNGNDVLTGSGGNDYLAGGYGADTLTGGAGNDVYIVDNAFDKVVELSDGGNDWVQSSISYVLAANVDSLALIGTLAINGTGNALDNIVKGNLAANLINGGAGNDNLYGGAGADTITGGSGDDVLDGGADKDGLSGGDGADIFVFRRGEADGDTIVDFAVGDHIALAGYGTGATATFADGKLTITFTGGVETITIDGAVPLVTDWSFDGVVATPPPAAGSASPASAPASSDGIAEELPVMATTVPVAIIAPTVTETTASAGITPTNLASGSILRGSDAADRLVSYAGGDRMEGGDGNDTYVIDSADDVVVEWHNGGKGGIDTVLASVTYALGANVENLTLAGSAAIDGTGSDYANVLTGNDAANRLDGKAGVDVLYGNGGDDVLLGGTGADRLFGGDGKDGLTGGSENDALYGNDGDDLLDGGTGADRMEGGDGNDTYVVDHAADIVVEWLNLGRGGTDTVFASINYTLGANVENLTLTGSANLSATGNAYDNVLTGNHGDNLVVGGDGNDVLYGGDGEDTFLFGPGSGRDSIRDFDQGDRINLSAFLATGGAATLSFSHGNAYIAFGKDLIEVTGVGPNHLAQDTTGFHFV